MPGRAGVARSGELALLACLSPLARLDWTQDERGQAQDGCKLGVGKDRACNLAGTFHFGEFSRFGTFSEIEN